MVTFDPSEKIKEIQQLLISDKKKIGFLFGAGVSLSKKNKNSPSIPAIGQMTDIILNKLSHQSCKYRIALNFIKKEIIENGQNFNIETLLTNVETKISFIGNGVLNGLYKNDFLKLDNEIKRSIKNIVSVHKDINESIMANMVQVDGNLTESNKK